MDGPCSVGSGNDVPTKFDSPAQPKYAAASKTPMSAALKERLRKTRRSFQSVSLAKRLKVNADEDDLKVSPEFSQKQNEHEEKSPEVPGKAEFSEAVASENSHCASPCCEIKEVGNPAFELSLVADSSHHELLEKKRLMKEIQEKEELLRRLKMVKTYRSKNDLNELQALIQKWRNVSQTLLYELQTALSADGRKLSLTELIDNFGIDDELLHYNRADEDFMDP
ncbi:swi5-dependent recombination DNA repair protein 1 homolog [Protopterus annectens]|uniref:swi5-dependent recombination DNA repair protein 1 homolog n=1 Tax=Protopterus annectens TaxID=7888 RepID=UPI001CFA931A|nr:swi5-dependent recombination DNA repair protein 1 homolog [Protopterus annectens]